MSTSFFSKQKKERVLVKANEDNKARADAAAAAAASAETVQQAEARIAAEQQAEGTAKTKKAGALLKVRQAQGFGSNPNVAKPFLLAL